VVGTDGHTKVQNYIVGAMETLGWQVEQDIFDAKTPNKGVLTFNNIVAKLNPNAERFLVVSCHYDSKYFAGSKRTPFLGATDSAVPCAMMINMAHTLRDNLEQNRKRNAEVSLMFVFFDGEEAFRRWGPNDSIYGARHLAKKLENENFLKRIDIMILLDLLGAAQPKFYNYFDNTQAWYARLMMAEKTLKKGGHLEGDHQSYFSSATRYSGIEDDHIPFLERDVRILHIIPTPFPSVWHKSTDDRSVVDMKTVENMNMIFRVFLVEYLHLD
jgi:glutaminyl-peptide cyclotransferase